MSELKEKERIVIENLNKLHGENIILDNLVVPNEFHINSIELPERSDWECHLFGCGNFIVLNPEVGKVPNRFWRFMQYLCFGNKWIKNTKEKKNE